MNLLSGFADISPTEIVLVACVALFASVIGGVAGYERDGTGNPELIARLLEYSICSGFHLSLLR